MKVKNIIAVLALSAVLAACGNNAENAKIDSNDAKEEMTVKEDSKDQAKSSEDKKDSSTEKLMKKM